MRGQRIAAGRLAGLGPAQFEHVPAGRLAAEVMIKGDDAVHFGPGDIQRLGDQRLGGRIDVAELLLQRVQDRQQRAFAIEVLANAGNAQRPYPREPGRLLRLSWLHFADIGGAFFTMRPVRISCG